MHMSRREIQYTIRRIPGRVDEALRRRARRQGKSLNQVAVEALAAGAGVAAEPAIHDDLDFLIGTWVEDPDFDAAIRAQDTVDFGFWR